MQEELKKVQKYFPEAKKSGTNEILVRIIDNFAKLTIYLSKDSFWELQTNKKYIYDANERCDIRLSRLRDIVLCKSKDFNKILDVLKSIKRCEDE